MPNLNEYQWWGATFHRHFASNEIHRDGGPECNQPGTPREVHVFDPEFLAAHDAEVAAKALEDAADAFESDDLYADGAAAYIRARAARIREGSSNE